jgi:hypothetical protein
MMSNTAPTVAMRVSRSWIIGLSFVMCIALGTAFLAGRETAPIPTVEAVRVSPLHLSGSLRSATGQLRLEVMRKMNRLVSPP